MEPWPAGWTGGVPGAQMFVRAYGRRVSVVDVRVSVRVRAVSASPAGGNKHHVLTQTTTRTVSLPPRIPPLVACASRREPCGGAERFSEVINIHHNKHPSQHYSPRRRAVCGAVLHRHRHAGAQRH